MVTKGKWSRLRIAPWRILPSSFYIMNTVTRWQTKRFSTYQPCPTNTHAMMHSNLHRKIYPTTCKSIVSMFKNLFIQWCRKYVTFFDLRLNKDNIIMHLSHILYVVILCLHLYMTYHILYTCQIHLNCHRKWLGDVDHWTDLRVIVFKQCPA